MTQRSKTGLAADVVVVGTGFAGLAAALEARHHGAEVILLGSKGLLANNSALSGGQVAMVNTPLQKKLGVHDSPELFIRDLMSANNHSVDPELVKTAAYASCELYDWLTGFGADFPKILPWNCHSVDRIHEEVGEKDSAFGRGGRLIKLMHQAAQAQGVDIHMGVAATSLLTNEQGRVVGLRTRDKAGLEAEIEVRRGVVLGAGGYAKNKEMLKKYAPKLVGMVSVSAVGSTGDGIRMGMEVGAATSNLESVVMAYTVCSMEGGPLKGNAAIIGSKSMMPLIYGLLAGIAVNKEGRRFMDESFTYSRGSACLMRQTDSMAFAVFDEETRNKVSGDMNLFAGATPEDLGRKINIDAAILAETIASYNAKLPRVDAYGHPVEKRPLRGSLFAVPFTGMIVMTHGGLKINSEAQVIHNKGHVIPGLYAAGDNAAGLGGPADGENACPGYLTGCANMTALAFGRIAGRNAAGMQRS